MKNTEAKTIDNAKLGGLQGHSIGKPYPYMVVSIDNPTDMPKGLYWYVVDARQGSTDLQDRSGIAMKGKLASLYAHCNANALYARNILGESLQECQKHYNPYWEEYNKLTSPEAQVKIDAT